MHRFPNADVFLGQDTSIPVPPSVARIRRLCRRTLSRSNATRSMRIPKQATAAPVIRPVSLPAWPERP
jgi:hypothetical protein